MNILEPLSSPVGLRHPPRDVFDDIGVSDDAAVYRDRFEQAQKCWAHLLRKAIKLALLYPGNKTYQRFLDQLLQIYHDAKRAAKDRRLAEAGRKERVAVLEGRLCELLNRCNRKTAADGFPSARKFTKDHDSSIRARCRHVTIPYWAPRLCCTGAPST